MMRKGFTLLELIVVIIIIGVLATLGFIQYTNVIEKGRRSEARANLGTLRQLQEARFQDVAAVGGSGGYGTLGDLASGLPSACSTSYYFSYSCNSTGGCTATRCTTGGKSPQGSEAYTMTLSILGSFSGTGNWQ